MLFYTFSKFGHFERNFNSKIFTSYHEFFVTDELAIEDRDGLKLMYYVRRSADFYEKVDLAEKEKELSAMAAEEKIEQVADRCTQYGHYDTKVNDHWDERMWKKRVLNI